MAVSEKEKESATIRIALEGNIAAGKSTYLDIVRRKYRVTCVDEPVGKWQNVSSQGGKPVGGNLLDLFYKDPNRWAYTFQSYAFLSRMEAHLEALQNNDAEVLVMERSIHSDKHIFATNCWRSGLFNEVEWSIYCEWQRWILARFDAGTGIHGLVYLRTRPETCLARLQKRGRKEEDTIPLQYLQELHERHEEWLIEQTVAERMPPVLVLDCDSDFHEGEERCEELLAQTKEFIDGLREQKSRG